MNIPLPILNNLIWGSGIIPYFFNNPMDRCAFKFTHSHTQIQVVIPAACPHIEVLC